MKFKELEASQAHFSYNPQLVEKLRKTCVRSGIVGQSRALSALKMGMSVSSKGYNIFISGENGTGRRSAVNQLAGSMMCPEYNVDFDVQTQKLSVVKTGKTVVPPVIEETHPTYENIFGSIYNGKFQKGSLLASCGGFLILSAEQVIKEEKLWESIKSFAESSSLSFRDFDREKEVYIRPLNREFLPVKIILIGSDELYDKLCETDERFLKLFKICAEFDYSMPATEENISGVIAFILETAKDSGLKEVTDSGICELLRYSSWYSEVRDELTAKLSYVGDLLCEADYFAEKVIDGDAVKKAITERDFANGITESRINREIETGEMIISLEGSKVGVVNGLAVMDRGLVSFGTPAVISVSVAPGTEGIVNIEHEAGLSGEIHDKGLLILQGYLRKQYARSFPLSIYAGICFEQSYSEVDGDSASSSELFALLSAIGELAVRQDIAVTGSVNQLGDIQPVGGINEKITGFFDICQIMGLTGKQGVIIPKQNVNSLILPERIINAIEKKKFHIYPISSVDEGMEILTLRPSGERNQKGNFAPDTVNRIIEDRLKKLYEMSKPAS